MSEDSGEWLDSYDDFNKVEKQNGDIELDEIDIDLTDDDLDISLDTSDSYVTSSEIDNDIDMDLYTNEEVTIKRASLFEERFVLLGLIAVVLIFVCFVGIGATLYYTQDDSNTSDGENGTLHVHDRTVILVSLDGFRYEYFQDESLADVRTHLDALASVGAFSAMEPVFPSVTFPNHWTIVTGLYAESHGIVENNMYDPVHNKSFSIFEDTVNDPTWYGGESVWETYQKLGGTSASVFWPGSSLEGKGCNYSLPYDGSMTYEARVDQVMEWLNMPDATRPRFISLYLNAVDSAGHEAGPYSDEVRNAIQQVDEAVGSLVAQVEELEFAESVNFLFVSDHGMTEVQPENVIYLDDYIDIVEDAKIVTWGPLASIWGLHNRAAQLNYQLEDLRNATVYLREEIPQKYHYTNNEVIPDIVVVADEGWYVSAHPRNDFKVGNHGYDPTLSSMTAFLIAKGEYFKSGYESPAKIANIHLYSLMSRMLDAASAPNNGSWVSLCPLLQEQC